ATQARLQDPMFFFVRELINNQIAGLNQYQVKDMNFKYELRTDDLLISDQTLEAFKSFVLKREKDFQISQANINENLESIKLFLRRELATASYGLDIGQEVLLHQDPQVLKGLDEMENAKKLVSKSNSSVATK
ncbi:MAG: carboxyl-terminal processing protease, partial [bacterium]